MHNAVGLNLVCCSHGQLIRERAPWIGRMIQPRLCHKIADTAAEGIRWGADNGCFKGLNAREFQAMCERLPGVPLCLFVVVPDVVADHAATMRRWRHWSQRVRDLTGQPLAFVAQNGADSSNVPWDELDALFIGGDTAWKIGREASQLAWDAGERGKWVHMGRVNSAKRIARALSMRCDSFDGTKWARFSRAHRPTADLAQRTPVTVAMPGT
jgi:hypothetical protein